MRRRLVLTTTGLVTAGLLVLLAGFWFVLENRLDGGEGMALRQRAAAAAAVVVVDRGRLGVEPTANTPRVGAGFWLFDRQRRLVVSPGAASETPLTAARALLPGPREHDVGDVRLLSQPVQVGGHTVGSVVVQVSLVPYEDSEHLALEAAGVLAVLVLLGVALLTRRIVTVALAPVAQMTATAREWSEHDVHRRFALGPARDELTALGGVLDGLLAQLDAVLHHERTLTAEIAHELRTPLARIRSTAEVTARHGEPEERAGALQEIAEEATRLADVVEALVAAHKGTPDGMPICDVGEVLTRELTSHAAAATHLKIDHHLPAGGPLLCAGDPQIVARALSPLLDNATRHARSCIRVTVGRIGDLLAVDIADDGPGFATADLTTGLGLPLARRLTRALGGQIVVLPGPGGRVRMTLPVAARQPATQSGRNQASFRTLGP